MKPLNIYILTRTKTNFEQMCLERQLSRRSQFLKIKDWEMAGLEQLANRLFEADALAANLEFYYSFIMPKLGKEFDLLRISKDSIFNIELKSGSVSDAAIKKQLLLNKNYLSVLGKNVYSYTYISEEDRLVRLSNSGNLVESDFSTLCQELLSQSDVFSDDIETVFKEDKYLISPLSDPEKFLRGEYFLTSQQKDIKKKILIQISENSSNSNKGCFGFCGLPGTGKTLLLYDLAMVLSQKERVCVLHFGSTPKGLVQLDSRLKRVDFYGLKDQSETALDSIVTGQYDYILVDEGHMISKKELEELLLISDKYNVPVIISRVDESLFNRDGADLYNGIKSFVEYQITNRIRVNGEIASFVKYINCPDKYNQRKYYPSVDVAFSNDRLQTQTIVSIYESKDYTFVDLADKDDKDVICKENDKVVVVLDNDFYYESNNYLSCSDIDKTKKLFHVLSRARYNVSVVCENQDVFDKIILGLK